jgi:hypothetical protein
VPGVKADLQLERLCSQNVSITTRLVDTVITPMLLKEQSRKIDPALLITHRFKTQPHSGGLRDLWSSGENAGAEGYHRSLTDSRDAIIKPGSQKHECT